MARLATSAQQLVKRSLYRKFSQSVDSVFCRAYSHLLLNRNDETDDVVHSSKIEF